MGGISRYYSTYLRNYIAVLGFVMSDFFYHTLREAGVMGKPNALSEQMNCCQHCRRKYIEKHIYKHPELIFNMFLACEECGNKRCPKVIAHWNKCTGSNEPNQDCKINIDAIIERLTR